ncbi:MAG: hypothetical protein EWV44_00820 [Microcystis flos-aquae Mf_QC_C_20070823_S20T]|nr:MAG: hypothetical protein EWV44_00820 [Microcystis flos-aquae Mf_QC_C_20070823_S20T]
MIQVKPMPLTLNLTSEIKQYLSQKAVKNYQTPPLSRVGLIHESTLPYQGEQGGSNLKSIFNLIITSYLLKDTIL